MTGYGTRSAKISGTEISVVVKSVNGRFLETRVHLPKEFFKFESQLKKILGYHFRRGTVDIFVHRRSPHLARVKINSDLAHKWANAFKDLERVLKAKHSDEIMMSHVISLPHVFEVPDNSEITKKEEGAFFRIFVEAIKNCEQERVREGRSIKAHLAKTLKSMRSIIKKIESLRELSQSEHEARLKERIQRIGLESSDEPARFAQELILFLDKCDITEEIERLKEHVQMCGRYLRSKEEQGKKLDFYTQELLREVNTIGSKANSALITEQVVQAKGFIEAFKEQVQNIE